LVPDRSGSHQLLPFDSQVEKSTLGIPAHIVNLCPRFWETLRPFIGRLRSLLNNKPALFENEFRFVLQYPELLTLTEKVRYLAWKQRRKITPRVCRLTVQRGRVLNDSFGRLGPDDWRSTLHVTFSGEVGVDAGGLTREWLELIVRDLFNENYGLFKLSENMQSSQPNPSSGINDGHLDYFRFAGRVIARAVIEGQPVDAHLTAGFLKQLLGRNPGLRDLEELDSKTHGSLVWIRDNDPEGLDMTFSVTCSELGVERTFDLIENGSETLVTHLNKHQYIDCMVEHYLKDRMKEQTLAFCQGFYNLIPINEIRIFTPAELDLTICGVPDINIGELRRHWEFQPPYWQEHPVIQKFFNVLEKWDNGKRAALLRFWTGTSAVPAAGFKTFREKGRPMTLAPGGDADRLPVAHTCVTQLDLPEYGDEDEMDSKLTWAIYGSDTFELM
jgi:hypothetical protein